MNSKLTRPEYDYYLFPGRTDAGPGYYCPLHRKGGSRDWLLLVTTGGAGEYRCRGEVLTVGRGDITLIRPGTPYDIAIVDGSPAWDTLWTHFIPRPHWLDWLQWPEAVAGIMNLRAEDGARCERIAGLMTRMIDYWHGSLTIRKMFAMAMLEQVLLECAELNPDPAESRIDSRMRTAVEYISQNLSREISVPDLARVAGLSPSRFARVFAAQIGRTPREFIEDRRMELARERLTLSGRSIKEISVEAGYDDPLYFSRRFKKLTGMCPERYRDR